jgi:DNA-binding transcriptional ArsR family regulator
MSRPEAPSAPNDLSGVFAALGHPARLALIEQLEDRGVRSLSELAAGAPVTRQATARHLEVLAAAGLVRRSRVGRETLFALSPAPLGAASEYLEAATARWEGALERLRRHVEEQP